MHFKIKTAFIIFPQIFGNILNIWVIPDGIPDGISQRYNQEEVFALHIRMLPALAFLTAGNVIEGFEELV